MHYENSSTQKLYRRLRQEGASAHDAAQTIQLMLEEKPVPAQQAGRDWWTPDEPDTSNKHGLPYFHGNRRF